MVEQPFVPFGRDGAIAEGKDRVPRACSGTGTGSWNGEPVVVWLGEIMCGSEEGKIGGREGKEQRKGHSPVQDVVHGVAFMLQGRCGCWCGECCCRCCCWWWRRREARPGGGREEGGTEGHDEGVAEEGKEGGVIPRSVQSLGSGCPSKEKRREWGVGERWGGWWIGGREGKKKEGSKTYGRR